MCMANRDSEAAALGQRPCNARLAMLSTTDQRCARGTRLSYSIFAALMTARLTLQRRNSNLVLWVPAFLWILPTRGS